MKCGLRFTVCLSVLLNIETLFSDCGLWIVYCGVHNADFRERYTLRMSACLLPIVIQILSLRIYLWILKCSIKDRNLICGLLIVVCTFFIVDFGFLNMECRILYRNYIAYFWGE